MPPERPPNDSSIGDDDLLLRRFSLRSVVDLPVRRVSKDAYYDPSGGSMSVVLQGRLLELGGRPEDALEGNLAFGLMRVSVQAVRDLGFGVERKPVEGAGLAGLAHAEVHCRKTDSLRRKLIDASDVLLWPPDA